MKRKENIKENIKGRLFERDTNKNTTIVKTTTFSS